MVAKTSIVDAAEAIHEAFRRFVKQKETDYIQVFESSPGFLRAVIGSDRFKGIGLAERQEIVWEYLNQNVDRAFLAYCFDVQPLDVRTYKEHVFRQSSSRAADMFLRGSVPADED